MATSLELTISRTFPGLLWNLLADGRRLFVEVRDAANKEVSFSCLDLSTHAWLRQDKVFEERWWISLAAAAGDTLLLTVYTATNNPDQKSLIAYDVVRDALIWWQNGFSLTEVRGGRVHGRDARSPEREVVLDLFTGNPVAPAEEDLEDSQNFAVIRPFQYEEGTPHFDTVRDFLHTRVGLQAVRRIEYLETGALIVVSAFVQQEDLANYLIVFDTDGNFLIKEKLAGGLKGVALDTFFVFSDHLIFVREGTELRGYKI